MRYPAFLTIAALTAVALAAGAPGVGAQTTSDKIERKTEQAKDKAKSTTQEVKADVKDSWLTAKTKIALFADERVKGRQIKVETNNGVVALRGQVDSAEAKSAAAEIAKGIEGVRSVRNELHVSAPASAKAKAADAKDDELTQRVKQRLARDRQLGKANIDVQADGGVVTLKGDVPSIDASARASEIARDVPGVRSVRNNLNFPSAG